MKGHVVLNTPDAPQMGVRVFVYGTLKGMTHGKFIGEGRTMAKFLLFDGNFPVLKLGSVTTIGDPRKGFVLGEVYDVSLEELKELDRYEGYPDLYGRQQWHVMTTVQDGKKSTTFPTLCWIYHGNNIDLTNRRVIIPDKNESLSWS